MIDLHNHVIPGVDDGARDLEESRRALRAFRTVSIDTLVATPHFDGSLTRLPERADARLFEIDDGWAALQPVLEAEGVRVLRGAEVKLDAPDVDFRDARLRLAGTRFVLVEFGHMTAPPKSADVLYRIRVKGWMPVLAHPERYTKTPKPSLWAEWAQNAFLQINAGSLLGQYGDGPRSMAARLLEGGWVSFLASDYHCRGEIPTGAVVEWFEARDAVEQLDLLTRLNPARLLDDLSPQAVPAVTSRSGWWGRLFGPRRA